MKKREILRNNYRADRKRYLESTALAFQHVIKRRTNKLMAAANDDEFYAAKDELCKAARALAQLLS